MKTLFFLCRGHVASDLGLQPRARGAEGDGRLPSGADHLRMRASTLRARRENARGTPQLSDEVGKEEERQ